MNEFNQNLQILSKEINGKNRQDVIEKYEQKLCKNIEILSTNENFFKLPLNNIFSIISQVDFNEIEEKDKLVEIIHNIIKNIIENHSEENETILILQKIDISKISFTYEELFSFLDLITNCPILVSFCNIFKENNKEVDLDYSYELERKNEEIEKLKQTIISNQEALNEFYKARPKDLEPNIFKACKEGKLSSVQWLIEKENVNKDLIDSNNCTPILIACQGGQPEIVDYLISKGANIEVKDKNGDSLIHFATIGGFLSIVQYLIEKQNINKEIKGKGGKTPLHYACEKGHLPIIEYLVSKGVNIEARDKKEKTPVHYACQGGHLQIVEYLMSKYVNIGAITKTGNHVIHYASMGGLVPIIHYLITQLNVNKDLQGNNKKTPLHCACEKGQFPVVEYLVSIGANKEARGYYFNDKWTPLHYAAYFGYADIVKYLVSEGADKNAKNQNGETPYDWARNDEIRNLLK